MSETTGGQPGRRGAAFAACYAAVLVAYLFVHPEPELWHWLSLVVLPLIGVALVERRASVADILQSIGLDAARMTRGWQLALVFSVLFQGLQLLNTAQRTRVVRVLSEPRGALLVPLAFALMLGTAATTEEVFFRGVLQRRLAQALGREWLALLIGTLVFALYHVPYAYLNHGWSSAGDIGAAVRLAAANGLLGGLPLGILFWRSGHNLAAAIVLHACIDLIPALLLLDRLLPGVAT